MNKRGRPAARESHMMLWQAISAYRSRAPASVARQQLLSYALILSIFLLLLVVALSASWMAIELVNDTRSYATGEGRYSKAEKIAVLNLHRYAYSGNPKEYERFLEAIKVPRGDHIARSALSHSLIDVEKAAKGFLQGENHPDDIGGMIRLFRWFSWWKPFAEAVSDWRQGDHLVDELIREGARLHAGVVAGKLDAQSRAALLGRIDNVDHRLTDRENMFSTHMGEAARAATALVVVGLGVTTILLWTIGIIFATRLFRNQIALDRQLASSERRFRDYAEVASDWYWEMDADNRITYVSERFQTVVGLQVENVLDQNGSAFIANNSEDDAHRDECLVAIAAHRPFRGLRLRYVKPDGTVSYWSISGKPHVNAAGTYLGYRGVGSDITAQVNDAQVLMDAKNRAEVANRAKSEFLANMSHELRTPLNAILGFSDIINRRMFGREAIDRYADYASDIHQSGNHLLAIIDDILDLSKIEAGRATLIETEVSLDKIVDEVRTLLGERLAGSGVEFRVALPTFVPRLRVDERKFVQILVNLLSNAFKFTPPGGSVTLAAFAEPNGGLSVSVRDTGIGIAEQDIETVMAPFGQVESAFSRRHHGTGLGLPLAKSLTELHGGTLAIESKKDSGTTVTVSLPAWRMMSPPMLRAAY